MFKAEIIMTAVENSLTMRFSISLLGTLLVLLTHFHWTSLSLPLNVSEGLEKQLSG